MGTASSFLAYAILAGRHGRETSLRGRKTFYHLGGLTEGTETIIFFALCLALPQYFALLAWVFGAACWLTRSEEHTSELQSLMRISYAVFCLKKKNTKLHNTTLNPTQMTA